MQVTTLTSVMLITLSTARSSASWHGGESARRAIEQAVDDEEVQKIWVSHTVEMAREFHANGVKSIYVSAPKGEAAELFLRQCVQEGIIAERPAAQRSRI